MEPLGVTTLVTCILLIMLVVIYVWSPNRSHRARAFTVLSLFFGSQR